MSIDLGRRLITAGLVSTGEVEAALFISVVRGVPLARVLLDRGVITEQALEDELGRAFGLGQRSVPEVTELAARLPLAMCRRLAAVPTRFDSESNTVEVTAADPFDPHIESEFSFHLGARVRILRAPIAAVEEAIRRLELDEPAPTEAPQARRGPPPLPYAQGAPPSGRAPTVEETPIPLVRKLEPLSTPQSSRGPDTAQLAPPSEENSEPVPLRNVKVAPPPEREAPAGEQPSVSFPSQPPDGDETEPPSALRIAPPETPAYGTRVNALRRPIRRLPQLMTRPAPAGNASTSDKAPGTLRPPLMAPAAPPDHAREPSYPPAQKPSPPPARKTLPPPDLVSAERISTELKDSRPTLVDPTPPEHISAELGPSRPTPPKPAPPERISSELGPSRPTPGEASEVAKAPGRAPAPALASRPPKAHESPLKNALALPLPPVSPGSLYPLLSEATTRDEVVRLALRGLMLVAKKVAVFAVRRDSFAGWACNAEFGDLDALRALSIPQELPSVLATAAVTGLYLGPVPATPAHESLVRLMKQRSSEVGVSAVRVGGRPAMILLADELRDSAGGARFMEELSSAIGDTLARLLSSKA